jgi:hypothetical protein
MAGDTVISPGLLLYPSLLGRTGSTTETLARVEVVANLDPSEVAAAR